VAQRVHKRDGVMVPLALSPPSTRPPARIVFWPGDSDAGWRAALAAFDARVVADRAALDQLLASGEVDVLVCTWRDELLPLAAKLSQPLVVVDPRLPAALVDAVAAGAPFHHVAHAAALAEALDRLTRAPHRAGPRQRIDGWTVAWANQRRAALVDFSRHGLSFVVDDADLAALLPDATLGPLVVQDGERVVLSGVCGVVRHVEALKPPGRYRIGCALVAAVAPAPPPVVLRDRALCAALLKSALRGGLWLEPHGGGAGRELLDARLDVAAGTIVADGGLADAEPDGVVRGRFHAGGRVYRLTSRLTATAPLVLTLPTSLEEFQRRATERHHLPAAAQVTAELRSPLGGPPLVCPLVDLSTRGFAFEIDPEQVPMPLGLRLGVTLRWGELTLHASATVRHHAPGAHGRRCGAALDALDEAAHARLADRLVRLRFPELEDGGGTPFAELADFFRATGFLYPGKEAALAPIMSDVRHTFEQLYGRPSRLFKSVIARHDDALVGHVSSLRLYQRTWMSQHLAASHARQVSHLLNLGAAEYFGQSPDLEYFRIFFQRDIRWPMRVFGGFARSLRDPAQSDLRQLRHLSLPTDAPLPFEPPPGIEVVEASDDTDLAHVERHFLRHEPALIVRSDDLLRGELGLGRLNRAYARLGLYRRRRVLLALRRGVCVGFALAEVSSPGLNLSEALSLFRIHIVDAGATLAEPVHRALLVALQALYRQAGRPHAGGLVRPEAATELARLGLEPDDTWLQWTCHRALYPRFCDHVDRLFAVRLSRARAVRADG
jgi:hypothetical protein